MFRCFRAGIRAQKLTDYINGTLKQALFTIIFLHVSNLFVILLNFEFSSLEKTYGALSFSLAYLQATYFNLMTFTTVGYGNIYPVKVYPMLFAMGLQLLGNNFFGFTISRITELVSGYKVDELEREKQVIFYL